MRERERGEFFRARQRVSFRAHTHKHNVHEEKKICQVKKRKVSSSCVDPDLCPNGKGRADLSKSFFLSRARRGANGVDRSIEARARRSGTSDRWDRGRLPSLRETTHRIVRGKWGGARSFKPNTPNASTSKAFGKVLFSATNSRESETTTTTHPHLVREVQILHDSFVDFWIVQVAFDLRSRSSPPRDVFLVLLVVGG